MTFRETPSGCCSSCGRWRKSSRRAEPASRSSRYCPGRAGYRSWSERDAAQAEIEKLRLLDPAAAARAVRPALGEARPRPAPARPGGPRAGRGRRRGGAGEPAARSSTPRPPRVRRRNLGALPAHLPRVEVLVDVEDKSCPCCGGAMHVIGEDASEMLDIVPAALRVRVIRRPRYGCRACEEAVVQAPAPGAADHRRDGDRGPARARAGGQVRRFPALVPPGAGSSPGKGVDARPLHAVRLGRAGPAGGWSRCGACCAGT